MDIAAQDITALVLAGGRGQRLGGIDKGWCTLDGVPLIRRTLDRLSGQCGAIVISANRSHADYEALGYPVVADRHPDYAGPLAGIAAGLAHVQTTFTLVVPVDTPQLPRDLVQRLQSAMLPGIDLVTAASPRGRQPLHCLMRTALGTALSSAVSNGERRVMRWQDGVRRDEVTWASDRPFENINAARDAKRLRDSKAGRQDE